MEQIDQSSIIALIGLLGTVLPVGISYVLTKNKEIDVSIRQEKTKRYDGLIGALVMIERSKLNDVDAINNFNTAYNRAMAYASDLVLQRCNKFAVWLLRQKLDDKLKNQQEVHMGELIADRDDLMSSIYEAIRLDINPKAKYSQIIALRSFRKNL